MTKSQEWFKNNVTENEEELINIGKLANKILYDSLSLKLMDERLPIALYGTVLDTIIDVLKDKEDKYSEYSVNIANRLKIGYSNTDDDDDEKMGNFMVYIRHLENKKVETSSDEDETDTIVLCTQWNAANISDNADVIREIQSRGKKAISNMINLQIESNEFVIPVFCIIHEQIINFIKLKRAELDLAEYELNFAGLYTVGVRETDDGEEEIYYDPSISLKLRFKNDAVATGSNE